MCGIAGFVGVHPTGGSADALKEMALKMANAITYRGPDDHGVWVDENRGVGLSHRRLSIIDLSPAGHQPMVSASGRLVIVYNGEVFNFAELRADLEKKGIRFRGHSDTEVILEACEVWGIEETAKRLIGMFAFAIWDRRDCSLSLLRDRLGIKPLYWGSFNKTVIFGSELKALKEHPSFQAEIDRDALTLFLRHNYIPGPYSIYRGVRKQTPGTIVRFDQSGNFTERVFWALETVASDGLRNQRVLSDEQSVADLEKLLLDAVGRRMVADVPLGAFLSGGVDSSLVVALMQAQSSKAVKTFSIGFAEKDYNEAPYAAAVAKHLGTDHTELIVTPRQAMDVIPRLPHIYDEPFADSSQIPTFLVSELTRRHVTVSLSGDGGDELFAGYNRYQFAQTVWRQLSPLPAALRKAASKLLRFLTPEQWNALFSPLPGRLRPPQAGDKLHKLAGVLESEIDQIYLRLLSHWNEPDELVLGGHEPPTILRDQSVKELVPDPVRRMQYLDTLTYLPDDILVKVDRASMAVSLEARVPLLDHRIVSFAWSLPEQMLRRDGQSKWILRQVLYKYVPKELIERPKMGFGVPIDSWLRGPLRDWAESLIDESRLRREGFLRPEPIQQKWKEHLSGQINWSYLLWDILMFQSWLEAQNAN
jgi:asparagine synthase (glutamine-hydrolysing)